MTSIESRLTGIGAPFELVPTTANGVPCRIFRRGPATLQDLYRRAHSSVQREFIVCESQRFTYGEILRRAHAISRALAEIAGVGAGSRVGIVAANGPGWLTSFVAVTSIGATAIVIHDQSPATDMAAALDQANCAAILADESASCRIAAQGVRGLVLSFGDLERGFGREHEHVPTAAKSAGALVDIRPEQPALIAFTSGTTGRPKGIVSSHRNIVTGLMNMLLGAAMTAPRPVGASPSTRYSPPTSLIVAPFSHISGYSSLLLMWYLGGRVVALPEWSVDSAIAAVESESATSLVGATPVMIGELLRSGERLRRSAQSLRSIHVQGAHMHARLRREMAQTLPDVSLGTGYGMTETNGSVCVASATELLARPTTCGRPLPSVDLRIVREDQTSVETGEIGEIWLRGAMIMQGYDHSPQETGKGLTAGWLKTGDLGRLDAEGYLHVADRMSHIMMCGDERVSLASIEQIVHDAALAREVVALGIDDPQCGRKLVLAVVPHEGERCPTEAILARLAANGSTVAPQIVATDTLPRTASGKVDRIELQRRIFSQTS